MEMAKVCDSLAGLLRYPDDDFTARLESCAAGLRERWPEAAYQVASLAGWARSQAVEQIQEAFVQTFDLNPVCSLEVGWHLFGENYDRGEFLVQMRRRLRQAGVLEYSELPDHLSHVLAVIGRMEPDPAAEFWARSVRPALKKMLENIGGHDNPLESILHAIFLVLESACASSVAGAAVKQEVAHV